MEGKYADILIFDEHTIQDRSVFENPHQLTTGISHVWVNGKLILENGQHNGQRSGQTLKGQL